ncbi:MAG: hypothetical protein NW215_08555 [Hyphomicrobiales bacterium]|nr:hypothetical protein [Hyphomicrobiales bacterium]
MRITSSVFAIFCFVCGQAVAQTTPPASGAAPAARPAPKPATPAGPAAAAAPAVAPGAAPVAPPRPKPVVVVPPAKFLEKHDDWHSYVHEAGGSKLCFAAAIPQEKLPKEAKRGPIHFYLTTWPKDGVRNEASVSIGYPLKQDGSVTVIVGAEEFEFFPRQDKAFIKDPARERRLVEVMTNGAETVMLVKGVSARGTETTDKYSLSGFGAAVKRMDQACP